MRKPDVESLRNQLHMLERAVRAVRASLEALTVDVPDAGVAGDGLLGCPLTALLASPQRIERRNVGPYESVADGVCIAFPPKSDVVSVAVESRAFAAEDAGKGRGSSCLLLRVTRKPGPGGAWATVEVEMDPAELAPLTTLQARLILSFQSRGWRPLGSYRVFLRLFFDKEYKDYCPRTFPALDVPIEASYRVAPEDYAALPRIGVRGARLIIGLPMVDEADYTAVLSFCEVAGS